MTTLKKFRNLEEINQYLTKETRVALEETLDAMIPKLRFFIDEDVYRAYHPTFYKRTRWLKRRNDVIEHYISNLQRKLRGGIRITNKIYDSVSDRNKFQHGNPKEALNAESFLDILNGESGTFNPFGFPYIKRRSFWEDFLDWAKDNYAEIFQRKCKRHKIDLKNIGSSENVVLDKPKSSKETASEPPATSITGSSLDRQEQGWHSIGNNKPSNKGIDLHMKLFGVGSGNSALSSALDSMERGRGNFASDIEKGRAKQAYKSVGIDREDL